MSLLDALLLEEPVPSASTAREIFIAIRNDGAAGSGTVNDPFDGETRLGPALSATLAFDPLEAIAVSYSADFNPASPPDSILIENVTGKSATLYNQSFSGAAATLEIINDHAFKVRLGAVPSALPGLALLQVASGITATPSGGLPIASMRLYWPVVRVSLTNHGFIDYDVVRISDAATTPATSLLNGDFAAVTHGADYFWCLLTTNPPSAASGTAACARVIHRFDEVIRGAEPNSLIHVGPGTFKTRGSSALYGVSAIGYQLLSGQKLRGAGIDVTVLKLVHAFDPYNGTGAVVTGGASLASHVETSDFTVDCNLSGQPVPGGIGFAPVTCGGIALVGKYHRLRRVRAVNWGCQDGRVECFVMGVGTDYRFPADGVGDVLEDCVVEKPSENNVRETTCLNVDAHTPAYHRGCELRRNYINCEYSGGHTSGFIAITALTFVSGTTWRLTTAQPHNRTAGNNVAISNVYVWVDPDRKYSDVFNGSFAIESIHSSTEIDYKILASPDGELSHDPFSNAAIGNDFHGLSADGGAAAIVAGNFLYQIGPAYYHDTWSTKSVVVRDNRCFQVYWLDYQNLAGFDLGLNPDPDIADGTIVSDDATHLIATFTAVANHGLIDKQGVQVRGVPFGSPFNGVFEVEVLSLTVFRYTMNEPEDESPAGGIPKFDRLRQVLNQSVENNICELAASVPNNWAGAVGVMLSGGRTTSPFVFPQSVIRGNWIQSGGEWRTAAIGAFSAPKSLIQNNLVVSFENPQFPPLDGKFSKPSYFHNQTSAGKLVPGHDVETGRFFFGLDGTVEDSLVACFL